MTSLNRKLFRDLLGMKGQAIAIGLVIGCGVATFVMSMSVQASLKRTQDQYYERQRFGHIFAHLKRAPNALADRIAELPGVARVQHRVVTDVTLDVPGMIESASGRLISISEEPEHGLNELYLRRGRWIEPGRRGEVLVSESFAEAQHLEPGAEVKAIINGRLESLKIVGVALSPEYVYEIRPGELLPDSKRFGIFWMGWRDLAAASGLDGSFNDVSLALMRGASEPEVIRRLDLLTEPYGGNGAFGRSDQLSHRFVTDEISHLKAMASIPPAIFLTVAAFLLNVVLTRLIGTQREQIAALKAFGYTPAEIGWHYAKLAGLIALAGVILGTMAGARLGHGITVMYAAFFHFPVFVYRVDPAVLVGAVAVGLVATAVGVAGAVRAAVKLPPAEAMRPEPPPNFGPTLVERLGWQQWFSQGARMVMRNLERKPLRTSMTVFGLALAVSVLILGSFSRDMVTWLMDFQFRTSQHQDFTLSLNEAAGSEVLQEIARLPGVQKCEPIRSVPVRVRSAWHSRRLGLVGLGPQRVLFPLLDMSGQAVPLPDEGVVLSEKLGEILGLRPGDRVTIEILEGRRAVRDVVVSGFIRDFQGLGAYMNISALARMLDEGETANGAYLSADPAQLAALHRAIKTMPRIMSIGAREAMLESFQRTVSENLLRMRFFNIIFATIIAFGVVYNSARIAVAERGREFATLRVLGFTRVEVSRLLLGEVGTLTVIAVPIGLVLGYLFARLAVAAMQTENQRFPYVVFPATYASAVVVIIIASVFSGLVVRRRLDNLNLVSVLKARD